MAREVVWSVRALEERREILDFWKRHNQSSAYSKKLNSLFKAAVRLIAEHPHVGRSTDMESIRVKIIRDYLMFYEVDQSKIYIHSIWDSRQDPSKLSSELK
jgi:toxin YoeB